MKARQEVTKATGGQYRSASKKRKASFWTSLSPPLAIVAGMRAWCCGMKDVASKRKSQGGSRQKISHPCLHHVA